MVQPLSLIFLSLNNILSKYETLHQRQKSCWIWHSATTDGLGELTINYFASVCKYPVFALTARSAINCGSMERSNRKSTSSRHVITIMSWKNPSLKNWQLLWFDDLHQIVRFRKSALKVDLIPIHRKINQFFSYCHRLSATHRRRTSKE